MNPIRNKARCPFGGVLLGLICLLSLHAPPVLADQVLTLRVLGSAQPHVGGPSGGGIGLISETNTLDRSLANADIKLGATHSVVQILNPTEGLYPITLTGSFTETLSLGVSLVDTLTQTELSRDVKILFHGAPLSLLMNVAPSTDSPLELLSVGEPQNLRASAQGGALVLAWEAPLDPGVTGYRVYARQEQQTTYSPLGETPELSYTAPYPPRFDANGDAWRFVVVSVNELGEESLFSQSASNLIQLLPLATANPAQGGTPLSVSFTDLTEGGAETWSWDLDGDGTIDSTEQHPVYVYDTPGSFDVTLTVTGVAGTKSRVFRQMVTATVPDTDGDGIDDSADNCINHANADQRDTDGDGYGNLCDADFNNDGITNAGDLAILRSRFYTADPDADLNGDGLVNAGDLALFRQLFYSAPGPSALVDGL